MTYKRNLIIGICEKLQLPPSKYESASERYETISGIIQEDEAFKHIIIKMYPHGSFRLQTTVKPLSQNEYDLDFVVEIPKHAPMTPQVLYDHIYRILSHDGVHDKMIEKKSRCIRINYANDFHLDIMPGQCVNEATSEIIVPDKELKTWYHHSNPIAFANWFEFQAKKAIQFELNEHGVIKANTEPISDQIMAERLEPLRRAVQLVKRYRDIYCEKYGSEPTRSIILCTLMGNISSSYSDEIQIIQDFCTYVNGLIVQSKGKPFEIRNPVVDEILSEKWAENPKIFFDFSKMINALAHDILKLKAATINGDISSILKEMFGESITKDVIKERVETINHSRKNGLLGVTPTGVLSTLGTGIKAVKKNTFYGK